MSKREAISRYNLIINRIRKSPCTFSEISEFLQSQSDLQEYNFDISNRTFKRDLEDILSLYHIDIYFDFSGKVYRINDDEKPDVNRMLEAFDTFNALNVSNGYSQYVHFETRRPQGTEHFYGLLHAIKNSNKIKFTYQKFWEDQLSARKVDPYALKEFKGRWYVLAKDEKDNKIKTFGLDRIQDLEILKLKFKSPANFNAAILYQNCFGIINPEGGKPEKIILSFDPEQGKYIESFPLHSSQQTTIRNEKQFQFSLKVLITHDLVMELLSYGERVKVISPESLKKEITSHYEKALTYYE